jgi:two-component system cell cycle response regulator
VTGKILIVDDVATNRIVLKVRLASAYYETLQAAHGSEALLVARQARPDLVLLDIELPDMSGIEVCAALKSDPVTRDIPVVMITAFQDSGRRIAALRAGAEEVYWKPVDEHVLLARIRSLLRARVAREHLGIQEDSYRELGFAEPVSDFGSPALVALIASKAETAIGWKRALQPHMQDRLVVLDRDGALSDPGTGKAPDLFLIETSQTRPGEGLRLMSELRSRPATRHAAVCLMLPEDARDLSATALDLGASDLIAADAEAAEIAVRLKAQLRRKRQGDRLRSTVADGLRLAMIDPLTGLHNRRFGLPQLAQIVARANRSGREFAVLVIDLDRFKSVNDTLGHAAGDAALREVAQRLKAGLRPGDLVARIGGEEFLAVLPEVDSDSAQAIAERLRRMVADEAIQLPDGRRVLLTLSIGLAMGGGIDRTTETPDSLMAKADRALMTAKAEGRNQVTFNRCAA